MFIVHEDRMVESGGGFLCLNYATWFQLCSSCRPFLTLSCLYFLGRLGSEVYDCSLFFLDFSFFFFYPCVFIA